MKIYVVTKGDYDSYSVITATPDENLANAVAEKFNGDVEVFENPKTLLKPCWFIRFGKDGSVVEAKNKSNDPFYYNGINQCKIDSNGRVYICVLANDPVSAVKIAAKKRTEFLAEKLRLV